MNHSSEQPQVIPQVIVAGHVCVDIIPTFGAAEAPLASLLRPGHLTIVGPAVVSTGGAVSNTGLALHRLGIPVRLMGKIGQDLFGEAILAAFRSHSPTLAEGMLVSPGEDSSYTLVINPPGVDRIFIHCPGANDTFGAADVPLAAVRKARIFHFGYPTLMGRMHADDGAELARLMAAVKGAGVITSLDMSLPDSASPAGRADWAAALARTLPFVDIYAPNLEETLYMLDRPRYAALAGGTAGPPDGALLHALSSRLLDMGAAIVGLKLGDRGLYLRTTPSPARLEGLRDILPAGLAGWVGRELYTPCFRVDVGGTTGAGDCAYAGLLAGLLYGQRAEAVLLSAAAAGACSVERADATSGVPHWDALQARLAAGWARHPQSLDLTGWRPNADATLWYGPADTLYGAQAAHTSPETA
jgi:sugar/nucleoside kinase (ribokinase family)